MLLIALASSSSKAQKEPYIPLLDTNKMWVEAMRMEFGDFFLSDISIEDTITYNDTLFYELYFEEGTKSDTYLREDTIERKVYYRQYLDDEDELYYDFSMEVGDSIDLGSGYLYVDSINYINSIYRTIYLGRPSWDSYLAWSEGIGSLAGILQNRCTPGLIGAGQTELNCYYYNDELLYQSDRASIYGCHFEIDPDPPYLDLIWTNPDTVSLNGSITTSVVAWDYSTFFITATFTSPNQNEYSVSDFSFIFADRFDALFSDFNNEIGDWYLSNIHIEDEQNNITEENYTFENSPGKFYVKNPVGVNNPINSINFSIFPNPVNNNLFINANNIDNSQYTIEICDIFGKIIYTNLLINNHLKIDMSAYQSGIYFIKIITDNQIIYTNKFIKQ